MSSNLQYHRDLLDIIDGLRSQGISRYVDLPEIIVCGDQSAGKSSILEAISGLSFPTKDTLCTRFATELILRRDTTAAAKVSIIAGPERSAEEKKRLEQFNHKLKIEVENLNLKNVVGEAELAMGLTASKVFSTDILRIELSGPTQPHLTMVDLPGLFHAGNTQQSQDSAQVVNDIVRSFMKRPRSIILAVVSASYEFVLQQVSKLALELDPKGKRTLGLITKPDTLDVGSGREASFFNMAQNQDVRFRLGWHVVMNKSSNVGEISFAERDEAEAQFFSTGIWASLDRTNVGIKSLKSRLSIVLKRQILLQLPSLIKDVQSKIAESKASLQRFGKSRVTTEEQRRYLLYVSREFTTLMQAAVDGNYNHCFFGTANTERGYMKRLRALVFNTLIDFKAEMHSHGQARSIIEDPSQYSSLSRGQVSLPSYIKQVKDLMRRNRGRELPGTFNPAIIGELFTAQCQPWKSIVTRNMGDILQHVGRVIRAILDHVAADDTATVLFSIISKDLDTLKDELTKKVEELLNPHHNGHPITLNHYLTDTVQKRRLERRRQNIQNVLEQHFDMKIEGRRKHDAATTDLSKLLNKLDEGIEADMEVYASEQAVDYMQAYYKVSLKTFIDNISTLAVEQCLILKLPSLFSPEMAYDFAAEKLQKLVGESAGTHAERVRLEETLATLERGMHDLKTLEGRCPGVVSDERSSEDNESVLENNESASEHNELESDDSDS